MKFIKSSKANEFLMIPKNIYLKSEEKTSTIKSKKLNLQIEKMFAKMKDVVSKIEEVVCLINIEEQSLMIVQLKRDVELYELRSCKKIFKISDTHFLYENNRKLSEQSKIKNRIHFNRYYSKLLGGGKNDWINILEEIKSNINAMFQTYFPASNDMTDYIFYEQYYQVRNDILQRLKDKRIFIETRKVKKYIDKTLEICKSIKEIVEICKEDTDDPEMPTYPEFDPSTYPQFRFVECDNYMASRGLIKFNLDYVINPATNWNRNDLERNAYFDAPFVRLENIHGFVYIRILCRKNTERLLRKLQRRR
jgi:hypothetical protein